MTPQFKRSFQARALSLAISATVVNVGGFAMLLCSDAARADDLAEQTVRWIDSVRESSAGCAAEGERVPVAQAEPDRDAPAAEVR